jgi:hypothetical protein
MVQFINPIKIIVLLTFLVGLFFLKFRNPTHQKVLGILSICFINEFVALILKAQGLPIDNLFNINIIIHNTLWLLIIGYFLNKPKIIILAYIFFGLVNLLFFEGFSKFNYYTFVFGALLYTTIFIYVSFKQLKGENLSFFLSNHFVLLFAPVLFFLGLSFMFSFKSNHLTSTYIFDGIKLYTFINYFVNIIYYFFINLYIYKEKKTGYV